MPRHALRAPDDIVAVQRGDRKQRDGRALGDRSTPIGPGGRRKVEELPLHPLEMLGAMGDEIHLVHADDEVPDSEQRRDAGMAPCLLDDALTRIDEQDRGVGRTCSRRHVARVLHMTGRVGEDEAAFRR